MFHRLQLCHPGSYSRSPYQIQTATRPRKIHSLLPASSCAFQLHQSCVFQASSDIHMIVRVYKSIMHFIWGWSIICQWKLESHETYSNKITMQCSSFYVINLKNLSENSEFRLWLIQINFLWIDLERFIELRSNSKTSVSWIALPVIPVHSRVCINKLAYFFKYVRLNSLGIWWPDLTIIVEMLLLIVKFVIYGRPWSSSLHYFLCSFVQFNKAINVFFLVYIFYILLLCVSLFY